MRIREDAKTILSLSSKSARVEGMKLISKCLINNNGSLAEVEKGFGTNYYRFLVNELKKQINSL